MSTRSAASNVLIGPHLNENERVDEGLLAERLDTLFQRQLRDIEAFAIREGLAPEVVRRRIAILHSQALFSEKSVEDEPIVGPSAPSVRSILSTITRAFDNLSAIAGCDSLAVVVSPNDLDGEGWVLGSEVGKDFWGRLRGGGPSGLKTLRTKCKENYKAAVYAAQPSGITDVLTTGKAVKSADIKAALNTKMRMTLREAAMNPSAEMKWTKHTQLEESYGVRIVGWPTDIPHRNPSDSALKDNKRLLELLEQGKIQFIRIRDSDDKVPMRTTRVEVKRSAPVSIAPLPPALSLSPSPSISSVPLAIIAPTPSVSTTPPFSWPDGLSAAGKRYAEEGGTLANVEEGTSAGQFRGGSLVTKKRKRPSGTARLRGKSKDGSISSGDEDSD